MSLGSSMVRESHKLSGGRRSDPRLGFRNHFSVVKTCRTLIDHLRYLQAFTSTTYIRSNVSDETTLRSVAPNIGALFLYYMRICLKNIIQQNSYTHTTACCSRNRPHHIFNQTSVVKSWLRPCLLLHSPLSYFYQSTLNPLKKKLKNLGSDFSMTNRIKPFRTWNGVEFVGHLIYWTESLIFFNSACIQGWEATRAKLLL